MASIDARFIPTGISSPRESEHENGVNAYFLCGLKVCSEITFPELPVWRGSSSRPPDIEFSIGPVESFPAPDHVGERFQSQGDANYILEIPRVGRVLVAGGARIVFDPLAGADPTRVRLNLIGTVQSILWHQRGLLPLHASAVRIDGRAVAIAGNTGGGKSVLAAVLTQRGLALLSDDFTVLSLADATPMLLPGYQRVRLWDDACEALGFQDRKLARAHPVYSKFVVDAPGPAVEEPVPLSDILVLTGKREGDYGLERLGVAPAVQALLSVVHTPDAARALGRQGQVFHAVNALISGGVRVWRLSIPNDLARVAEVADSIIAAMRL
jgi:hypothetical protein